MAYTGDFAIVAEGVTDHHVLTAVLEGFYEKYDRELELRYEQSPIDATAEGGGYAPGGWTLVLDYFRQRKYLQALQFNRYLVVQIDTAIDHKRRLQSEPTLDRGGDRGKNPDAYRALAKALTKRKVLNEASLCNAGFQHFVEQLEGLNFTPEGLGRPVPSWTRPGMALFLGHETRSPHARHLKPNKTTWARSMNPLRVVSTTAPKVNRPSPRRFGHRAGGRTTWA